MRLSNWGGVGNNSKSSMPNKFISDFRYVAPFRYEGDSDGIKGPISHLAPVKFRVEWGISLNFSCSTTTQTPNLRYTFGGAPQALGRLAEGLRYMLDNLIT